MDSDLIVLNARLRTDQTNHVVWLSLSRINGVKRLDDAQLRCYINDVLAAEAEEVKSDPRGDASQYAFSAEIQPGDEVRLEASRDGLEVTATAIAPLKAQLVTIDTTHIERSPYDGGQALACKLQLQDNPNQSDWYRIFVHYDEKEIGAPETDRKECSIDFGFHLDPILNGSNQLTLKDNSWTSDSIYCKFQDTGFANKTAEVEIHIDDYDLEPFRYSYYQPDGGLPPRERNLHFDFLSISKEEYDFLGQYEKLSSGDGLGFLLEPIYIPSNVNGGLGFFSIASVSSQDIQL